MENGRDEDVCRQWDALAAKEHTHHMTPRVIGGLLQTRQVPILCQWTTDLNSNKHCLPCSNWNEKKNNLFKHPRTLAEINNGHKVLLLLLHGGVGKVHGGLLIPMKVTTEMNQVLIEQDDLLYKYLEQFFFKAWFSWIHLLCYIWIVYSWRQSTVADGVWIPHLKWRVFAVQKCAQNGYRKKWRLVHTARKQVGTRNKLQVEIGTKMNLGPKVENLELAIIAWWDCTMRTPMTAWPFPQTSHNDWAWARTV